MSPLSRKLWSTVELAVCFDVDKIKLDFLQAISFDYFDFSFFKEIDRVLQRTQNSDHTIEANQNTELYVLYRIEISHMVITKSLTRFKNLPNRGINIQEACSAAKLFYIIDGMYFFVFISVTETLSKQSIVQHVFFSFWEKTAEPTGDAGNEGTGMSLLYP